MKGRKLLSLLLVLALTLAYVPSDVMYVAAAGTEQQNVAEETDVNETSPLPRTEGVDPQDEDSVLDEEITDFQKNITDEAIALGVPDAFIRHYFANDLKDEKIADPVTELTEGEKDPNIKLEAVTSTEGIEGIQIMKVDTGVLARTKIDLGEFDFDNLKVGNMVYNMLAKKTLKGKAYFYFDKQENPFATVTIKRTGDEWGATKNQAVDVRNAGLFGKGHIYVTFIADSAYSDGELIPVSGVKGNLYFESLFFTEGSTPVIDFDLDNEVNSIETINGSPQHTITGYGNMNVKIPDGYQCEYSTKKPLEDATYELDYIRGRGNSTWLVDKKPYKIKLDKKANLFGMGESKHWVLLANYYDYSLLRNKLTTDLADKLGLEFTPKSVCVDMIVSGEYYGSYQLSQHIRIEESSVNIDDLEGNPAVKEPDITGGYLLSMGASWLSEDFDSIEYIDDQQRFRIEKPEYDENYPEEAKAAQMEYLRKYIGELDALVDALAPAEEENDLEAFNSKMSEVTKAASQGTNNAGVSGAAASPKTNNAQEDTDENEKDKIVPPEGKTWRDYLDEKSLIDYYLLQEFSINGDAFSGSSTFLYKERNGKLYFGPVWDFDFVAWAASQTNYIAENGVEEFYMLDGYAECPWFSTLIKYDPEFKQNVLERWKELRKLLTDAVSKDGFIDKYSNTIYYSALANYQVRGSYLMQEDGYWGEDNVLIDDEGNPYKLNYSNEIERLKKFINVRKDWVDANIDGIDSYEFSYKNIKIPDVPFYVDGELVGTVPFDIKNYKLKSDAMPEDPDKEGYVFVGWYYTQEKQEYKFYFDTAPYTYVEEDGWQPYAMHAKFIPESEYKEVEDFHFITDTIYVPLRYCTPEFESAYYYGDDISFYVQDIDVNLLRFLSYTPFDAVNTDDFVWDIEKGDPEADPEADVSNNKLYMYELGEITVSCTYKDMKDTVKVVAIDENDAEEPNGFTYDNDLTLKVGEYGNVNFAFNAEGYVTCDRYDAIEFQSMDEDVVDVNAVGEVYAKSAGNAMVTILDKGARKNKVKLVKVTVTEDESEETPNEGTPDEGTSEDETQDSETPDEGTLNDKITDEEPTTEQVPSTEEEPTTEVKTPETESQVNADVKKPGKATIKKIDKKKKASKQIKLTLKSVSGAKGYQVAVYTSKKNADKNKKAIVKTFVKKTKATVSSKKLKNKKTLYVKVRAYKLNGKTKVYGDWSKAKKVKLK